MIRKIVSVVFCLAITTITVQAQSNSAAVHTLNSQDAEMMNHQSTIGALTIKLEESFHAIADARDAKGYVQNKAVLKAHEANIKVLRTAERNPRIFLTENYRQCSANNLPQNSIAQYEQQMKGVVHKVVESFYTFEQTNDQQNNSEIYVTMYIGEAYAAHCAALKELTDTTTQYEQAVAQAMKQCP